jgi:hypothetical protein
LARISAPTTARIEPVTPPGAVFVTEPFAAMLMLEAPERFVTRYVGRIDLAKEAGSAPMYRLTRAQSYPSVGQELRSGIVDTAGTLA